MGYRKITVDGVDYEYVVGKTVTKIRPAGGRGKAQLFQNSEWGTPHASRRNDGPTLPVRESIHGYVVHPAAVAGMIKGKKAFEPTTCKRHPEELVTGLSFSPYALEIEGLKHLTGNCAKCREESAWNI